MNLIWVMPAEGGRDVPHSSPHTIAVFAGGAPVRPALAIELGDVDYVIAADGGLHAAEQLGLQVNVLVGDLDSVDEAAIATATFEVDRHPRAKDQTDIVLALDRAAALGARRLIVVSGGGGRLDHQLGNLLVLASPDYAAIDVDAFVGSARVTVVRDERELSGGPGELVSLFAVGGPARGVTTVGLRYPLHDDLLEPTSSWGVSNEFVGDLASVRLSGGTLLAVQPGEP